MLKKLALFTMLKASLLGNAEKQEDSVKDIGALLDWIATRPELDKNRVAVHGGSYGGYMVLASMVHFSDRLAKEKKTQFFASCVTQTSRNKKCLR
jgi:dienelactone hydrolase